MYWYICIGLKAKNSDEEEERKTEKEEEEIIVFPYLLYLDKTIFLLCLAY